MLEHEGAELIERRLFFLAHAHIGLAVRLFVNIEDGGVDALRSIPPEDARRALGELVQRKETRTNRVFDVVVDIGDAVGKRDDLALKRCGVAALRMVEDAVPHLEGKIEPLPVLFEHVDNAQRLLAVAKPAAREAI